MAFPNPGIYPQSYTYRDAKGQVATFRHYINAVGSTGASPIDDALLVAQAVVTALDATTNAALQAGHGPFGEVGVVQYGANGVQWQEVISKGKMVMQDAKGSLHNYLIPAPKIAMFEADQQTLNPGNGLLAALVGALTTPINGVFVCAKDGTQITNYMGGYWVGKKIHRRLNVFILTPALTGGLPAE